MAHDPHAPHRPPERKLAEVLSIINSQGKNANTEPLGRVGCCGSIRPISVESERDAWASEHSSCPVSSVRPENDGIDQVVYAPSFFCWVWRRARTLLVPTEQIFVLGAEPAPNTGSPVAAPAPVTASPDVTSTRMSVFIHSARGPPHRFCGSSKRTVRHVDVPVVGAKTDVDFQEVQSDRYRQKSTVLRAAWRAPTVLSLRRPWHPELRPRDDVNFGERVSAHLGAGPGPRQCD